MSASAVVPGHLYVVATPIGNLGDLSPRAQAVLAAVDRVCAEDTRTSGALLAHFGIRRPMQALHEHNEDQVAGELIEALRRGQSLALVSDAGTPLVSDPGFALVRAARAAGLPVIAIPGPCAAVAALSIAGIASDSFVFIGFLPSKAQARRTRLQELATEPRTLLFYESSHRIADSLRDIVAVFGGARRLCLARELSKLYEESITAAAAEVADWLAQDANRSRGEFVLVVEGTTAQGGSDDAEAGRVLKILLAELGAAQAARLAAAITGRRKNELYALATARGAADAE
jgi:16S rRNA (cytidine1402-2'-O)-methyltransferase